MPQYFIDINDGDRTSEDTDGYQFADDQEARKAAISLLPDIAADVLPDGDTRTMTVMLHDQRRTPIFKASLHLHGEWIKDGSRAGS